MENLTKTIRVSYCDPDATDSSSDEGSVKSQKRKVHEIEVEVIEKNLEPRFDSGDFREETGSKKSNLKGEGEPMVGVRTMRSGKFWAGIKDPGVFYTAEAASRVYLTQGSKFAAAKLRTQQRVEFSAPQNSSLEDLVVLDSHSPPTGAGKKFEGVVSCKWGKFGASIRDPFKRKKVWLGLFPTAEEASRAHLAKKDEFEAKKLRIQQLQFEAKLARDKRKIDEAASGKSTSQGSAARTRTSDIRRTNSGKFSAAITDPVTKRRACIGTFASEEEASKAYFSKEAEFAAGKLRANRTMDPVASNQATFEDSVSTVIGNHTLDLTRTRISDVRRLISGKFSAEIAYPITKTRISPGTFTTEEEATRAYPAMEADVAAEKLRANQAACQNSAFQDLVPSVVDSRSAQMTNAGKKIVGVQRRKSGRFGATIRDPFKKKNVSLGSFTTAEEASRAYLAKKAQLETKQLRVQKARLETKMLRAKRRTDRAASGQSTRISGVYRTESGKFSVRIRNPITKRRIWVGTFASRQKACRAYRAKETEFEELRAKQPLERVPSEKSLTPSPVSLVIQIETSDLSNETGGVESLGENMVSGHQEAGFGFFNGVQVVDKNGFLVGEFSMLDDFSICL